jgi:DNA-binding NtrC family response regulator
MSVAMEARVVASSGSDIEDAVREGRFRHDLFHRLRVLPLLVPPLRERRDDVPALARYFAARAVAPIGGDKKPVPAFSRDAVEALRDYAWPGNVRELRHVVEVACQTANETVTLTDLPDEVLATPAPIDSAPAHRQPTLDEMERRYVAATLRAAGGNQTDAAARLGISRKALWEKRKRYGMD